MKDEEKLLPFLKNIMIARPSKETWVGFVVAWVFVVLIIAATVVLARIGS